MAFGIDYSLSCPAVCWYAPHSVSFWYAHESKVNLGISGVDSTTIIDNPSVSRRAAYLARNCCDWMFLQNPHVSVVSIEDYAFSATGRTFHIGETAGILKYFLDDAGVEYHPIPPTVIKKFATGKGNADKPKMVAAFLDAHPVARTWIPKFFPRLKDDGNSAKSPLADLADAYWIARYSTEKSA